MRFLTGVLMTLMLAAPAVALEVGGVQVEPAVTVNNHTLKLNGSGVRKKFFVKVYVGSLYAERRLATPGEAMKDSGSKLIRMNFLHSRVEKEKIVDAFREGFVNNSPDMAGSTEVKKFLSLFTADFHRGDLVDLALGADGTVSARHNNRPLGTITSARLAKAVLAIYLGEKPADDGLKTAMLGK